MTEHKPIDTFELGLSDLLRAYTKPAASAFDPLDLARAAKVAGNPRVSIATRWWPRESDPALALLLVVAALAIALVVAVAAGRRPPTVNQVPDTLAYIRDGVSLVIAEPDGTGERVVADIAGRDEVSDQVAWSPSHRFIAHEDDVALTSLVNRAGLVIRTIDGVEVGRTGPASNGWAWSPIDDVIAYGRDYDHYDLPPDDEPCPLVTPARPCTGALVIIGPDGLPVRTIGHALGWSYLSGWSPDGQRLLVEGCSPPCETGVGSEIWVAEADGSGIRTITDTPAKLEEGPAWSPDGTRIAFSSRECDDCHASLWIMDADGTDAQLIAEGQPATGPEDDGRQNVSGPLWSPDGARLAFVKSYRQFSDSTSFTVRSDIFVWESGRTRQLTSSEKAGPVAWSSDGSTILIKSWDGITSERSSLEVIDADGSNRHVVVRNAGAFADW